MSKARYVEVPAESIFETLEAKGFSRSENVGNEVVYEFAHKLEPKLKIRVYTSIKTGADAVRGCGEDAIRVCAVLITPAKTYGISKSKRVYRTGTVEGVLSRMLDRSRDAYGRCNEWLKARNSR